MMSNCKILQMDEELVCDTPVPFYEMGISCGLPNEMGDIPPEMMMVPGMLTRGRTVSLVIAEGDSMIGVNIHDGDLLMVERTSHFNNQDIVAAKINGEDMLKSYYMDEYGRHSRSRLIRGEMRRLQCTASTIWAITMLVQPC